MPGVVEEDVQAAASTADFVEERADGPRVGHVGRDGYGARSRVPCLAGRRRQADPACRPARTTVYPRREKTERDGPPDARSGAGHERHTFCCGHEQTVANNNEAMKILVTGAAGFLGTRLLRALLDGPEGFPAFTSIVAVDTGRCPVDDPRVDVRVGSIVEPRFADTLVDRDIGLVYHLAAVLSGQSEAEFATGMSVNVDGTRALLEACRSLGTAPPVRLLEHGGGLRRRSSRRCSRGLRAAAADDLRRRQGDRGAAGRRVLAARLHRRRELPARHHYRASGQAEFRAIVVRQWHHPRAVGRHRHGLPGAARHAAVDQLTRRGDREPRARRTRSRQRRLAAGDR